MRFGRGGPRASLLAAALLLGGCLGGPAGVRPASDHLAAVESLETEARPRAGAVPDLDALALDSATREFLDRFVRPFTNPGDRARMLRYAITHPGLLAFRYDQHRSLTAREAFHARTGNCLSLSNLYVAMARAVGLDARFQEVNLGSAWTRDGDLYLINRHINVIGRLPGGGAYVMDFIHIDTEHAPGARAVSDANALAQLYNNRGVEHLRAGDAQAAVAWLKKALATDDSLDYVWSNLGTAYGRLAEVTAAEAAFAQALALNEENWSAINNLALLYRRTGRALEAERTLAGIERFRMRNPYYRLELAEHAYQAGDYREALAQAERAVSLGGRGHEVFFTLAKVYYRLGEPARAEQHLARAREIALRAGQGERYRGGLGELLADTLH